MQEHSRERAILAKTLEGTEAALAERETALRLATQRGKALAAAHAEQTRMLKATQQKVAKLKQTASWRVTAPARAVARTLKGSTREGSAVKRQMEVIRQSGLFDEAWYLRQYPDVAANKGDPVEHYVRFGAAEGRDPSSDFSTKAYLAAFPEVAAAQSNPLVHFFSHGMREEGATRAADQLTSSSSKSEAETGLRALRQLAARMIRRARIG